MRARTCEGEGSVEYDFLGVSADAAGNIFGLETYLRKYGHCDAGGPNLREHREEFDDFILDVPFTAQKTVRVLCCPEDRDCEDGH